MTQFRFVIESALVEWLYGKARAEQWRVRPEAWAEALYVSASRAFRDATPSRADLERYLKSLGVSVTKKNIEESRAAQAEMQQKLARANRSGSSIPVIDVMGRIFVGYSPGSLKQAVEAARHGNAAKHG